MASTGPTSQGHAPGLDLWTGRAPKQAAADAIEVVDRGTPLILSVPHSGTWVPAEALDFVRATRELLVDTDVHTEALYRSALPDVSCVVTHVSPYVVNVNRSPLSRSKPLLPPVHLYGLPTHSRPPTAAERQAIVSRYYRPYHQALRKLLERARKEHGYALLIDGHSLQSHGGPFTKDPGELRASFVVGDRKGDSAAENVSAAFTKALTTAGKPHGWTVARNVPYQGGWVVRSSGKPKKRIHALQLETHKALYLREEAYRAADADPRHLTPNPAKLAATARAIAGAAQAALKAASRGLVG